MALGVYWVGANGNIYTKDPILGVVDRGSGGGVVSPGEQRYGGASYSQIADPNPPKQTQQSVPVSAPAGPAAPAGPSAVQLNPLLSSLNSLDTILNNKNAQSSAEYNRAISGYNAQDALDRTAYDKSVNQNETALTSGDQAALLNAANGGSGLRAVLASLGALGGSGMEVVRRLVGLASNSDTGAVRQNFDTNANNIATSWSQAEQEQRQRREDAKATLDNNIQNNKAGVLTSRQSIYQQLANLYGDTAPEGKTYASKASALSAPIAETTRATVAPYAKASSLYSPAALQQYLAGTQNLGVNTSGNQTPINSPSYAPNKKKDQLPGVA